MISGRKSLAVYLALALECIVFNKRCCMFLALILLPVGYRCGIQEEERKKWRIRSNFRNQLNSFLSAYNTLFLSVCKTTK